MGCIYNIINKINGAIYIGSTVRTDPRKRWWRHTKDLRSNIHHSRHLQRAWNKYGGDKFQFKIVEIVDDEKILIVEQHYLDDRKKNYLSKLNYNECWIAGNCVGRKFSKETIQKLKQSHLGIRSSHKTRKKQSLLWDKKCKTPYSFTDPVGVVYKNIRNLRRFGREHHLNGQHLKKVHDGISNEYKGWIKTGSKRMRYTALDKTGKSYYNIIRLKPFCEEHNINYKSVHNTCIRQNRLYKGWKITKEKM
jgi:group I intron endonuclease